MFDRVLVSGLFGRIYAVFQRMPEVGKSLHRVLGNFEVKGMNTMTAYETIAKKRDNQPLTREEIQSFVTDYLKGDIQDYQMSAFLMSVYFNGMTDEEIFSLTNSYIRSGDVINLNDIPGVKVDKHSTGGVGDKVSIVLAPLVASLGVPVPMISGRGLGHTGGTLDKLESITGFQVFGSLETFRKQLADIGVAMLGQTNAIVPADRRIYALRDVTATVESIPLITASIMSKKIAEGIDALVLDVKYGNGAFMKEVERAEMLAQYLIKVGKAFDKKVVAYLTSMEQPLGLKIGNWLEIEECLDCFHGRGPVDLMEVILTLASEMLVLGNKAGSLPEARRLCQEAMDNGTAFRKFLEMVEYQGGDVSLVENPESYPQASYREVLRADQAGIVTGFDTRMVGLAAVSLGAGRTRAEDPVDPQAGIILHKKIGDSIGSREPLLEIRTNRKESIKIALEKLSHAIAVNKTPKPLPDLILRRMD